MARIGWIKIHRSMADWGWKKDPNMVALWIHILLNANDEDGLFMGKIVKKGSLATGRNSLALETGLTESQVRTCLNKLKNTGEIASTTHGNFSIISITNWECYQDNRQQDSQRDSQRDSHNSRRKNNIYNKPEDVRQEIWDDFVIHRKAKNGSITETVISRFRQEAKKIGWTLEQAIIESCAQNWQGFKADWVKNNQTKGIQNGKSSQNSIRPVPKSKSISAEEFDALRNPVLL